MYSANLVLVHGMQTASHYVHAFSAPAALVGENPLERCECAARKEAT